jgi:hypothetical protein
MQNTQNNLISKIYKFILGSTAPKIFNVQNQVVLELKVLKPSTESREGFQSDPLAAEQLFSVIHGILRVEGDLNQFSFEIVNLGQRIKFFVVCPEYLVSHIESQIYAQYPLAQITRVVDYQSYFDSSKAVVGSSLILEKKDFYPILTFKEFNVDPLSALTSSLSSIRSGEGLAIQVITKPRPDNWQMLGYEEVSRIKKKEIQEKKDLSFFGIVKWVFFIFFKILYLIVSGIFSTSDSKESTSSSASKITALSQSEEVAVKGIESKLTRSGFDCNIRILSVAQNELQAKQNLSSCAATFKQFSRTNLNSFREKPDLNRVSFISDYFERRLNLEESIILNTEELASIFHLPSASVDIPNIDWARVKFQEIPENLPTENCVILGKAKYRNRETDFGIKDGNDRLRHMYLIGQSGTGKSSFFLNMIIQDMQRGNGIGIIDPHGDLIREALSYLPDNRIDDLVLLDPSDFDKPIGFNVMQLEEGENLDRASSEIVNSFKSIFGDSWGPRLEYVLRNSVKAIMSIEGTTLLGIKRILEDEDYRKYLSGMIKDPAIRKFFQVEFAELKSNPKLMTETISPIQNKIGPFETIETVRNILCQRRSSINFNKIMDERKIFMVNLSKGSLGSDIKNFFGSLVISKIQSAVLSRTTHENRVPFYLYVDEFQNFTTDTFMEILSESRKYGLGLHLTHQYISQLTDKIREAVTANAGTIATYSVGPKDASFMKDVFAPVFDEIDIQSLPNFTAIIKLLVDNSKTKPFIAEIDKPWLKYTQTGNAEKAVKISREKYGVDRELVVAKIEKWVSTSYKNKKLSI